MKKRKEVWFGCSNPPLSPPYSPGSFFFSLSFRRALANGDITRNRALVARISYLSQDRPDLKFAPIQVCCAMVEPSMRDVERVKRIGRYLVGIPMAKCWFRWHQNGELDAYSDADWGSDEATRRSVSAGIFMRRGHCLMVRTKKQQVVALSSAESELYEAVTLHRKGWRSRASHRTWEYRVG